MQTNATKCEKVHCFEAAGLGKAPFTCTSVYDLGSKENGGGGTCDYCGTGIRYACAITSSDGRGFKVGCDCVRKTGDEGLRRVADAGLVEAKKTPAQKTREAQEAAARDERIRQYEIARLAEKAARGVKASKWAGVAAMLSGVASDVELHDYCDGRGPVWWANSFIGQVVADLRNGAAGMDEMSPRRVQIAIEIFAKKTGGRMGSKAYNAKAEELEAAIEAAQQAAATPADPAVDAADPAAYFPEALVQGQGLGE